MDRRCGGNNPVTDWRARPGGRPWPLHLRLLVRYAPVWIVVVQTFSATSGFTTADWVLAIVLTVGFLGAWAFVLHGPGPWQLDQAALVATVAISCWLQVLTGSGQVYVAGYSVLYVGPFFYGLPEAAATWAAGVLGIGLTTAFVGKPDSVGGLANAVGAFFFGFAAFSWGQVMREGRRNAELVEELRASRDAERSNAAAAERARLARELHDVLAHTLSSLALHLESTRALARSRHVDPEVAERLESAVGLARTGLDEARAAVGTLRDDDLPGPERLAGLVDQFAASSGLACRFVEVGEPRPLPPPARVALFRAAQEGLSNIAKHASATRVEVRLDWTADAVTLRVDDFAESGETAAASSSWSLDGTSERPKTRPDAPGNGLRGMRERAELAGGQVAAGPTPTGFSLEVSLPA